MALTEIDKKYSIDYDEHIKLYDGLPTNKKLDMLTDKKGLPKDLHKQIWERKQELTSEVIKDTVKPNYQILELFRELKKRNIKIYVTSNSIKHTTKIYLLKLGLMEYVDDYLSNEDVIKPKPHPSIYLKAMLMSGVCPSETLVVEDSEVGATAALESNANVIIVKSSEETNINKIVSKIEEINISKSYEKNIKVKGAKMNILIPMAGAGSRFSVAGYTFPKPLIEVRGKPMIQVVVDNLGIDATYTYVVRKEHYEKYNLKQMLNLITPNCNIVCVDTLTEGAACTTLLAKEFINTDDSLLIANSDQFIEWNPLQFVHKVNTTKCDGNILTFRNTHPKYSYVKLNEDGNVTEVKEKQVISDIATVGIYYWAKGCEYVKYAEQMIAKNIRFNNEFYVAPVYNEAIEDGKKITIFDVENWGIGTPEDLNYFLNNYKGSV
jgi:HAD superfamily hydrolase (TIGR01509 family)